MEMKKGRPPEHSKLRRIPAAVLDDVERLVNEYRKHRTTEFTVIAHRRKVGVDVNVRTGEVTMAGQGVPVIVRRERSQPVPNATPSPAPVPSSAPVAPDVPHPRDLLALYEEFDAGGHTEALPPMMRQLPHNIGVFMYALCRDELELVSEPVDHVEYCRLTGKWPVTPDMMESYNEVKAP